MIGLVGPAAALGLGGGLLPAVAFLACMVLVVLVLVVLSRLSRRSSIRAELGRAGLWFVTGRFGSGKSYFMATIAAWARRRGLPVAANFRLSGAVAVGDWDSLLSFVRSHGGTERRPCVVLVDEFQGWWPSDVWRAREDVVLFVHQVRKLGVLMVCGTQDWEFVGKRLRRLAQGVFVARRSRLSRRRHSYRLYDSVRYSAALKDPGRGRGGFGLRRRRAVEASYDTAELVKGSLVPAPPRRGDSGARAPFLRVVPGGEGSGGVVG